MEMVLIRERLWSIVCERRTKPETGAKAQSDFDEESERATATIFLHLDDGMERCVRGLRDPILIWKKLYEVCQSTGYAARYNLWRSLFTMGIEKNVSGYLDKIREITVALHEAGVIVPEEVIVSATLMGLGDNFATLITVITHGVMPTLDSLGALLLDEEAKFGSKVKGFREEAYEAKESVCWHCQKPGHRKEKCWELHPELRPEGGASTGPLPTPGAKEKPSSGKEQARSAGEVQW